MSLSLQHLAGLLPPHIKDPAPSTYLYLAQTAPTPQEALQLYESAIKLLENKVAAKDGMDEQVEEATKEELMKECITAIVAMIEIWMSDLWYVEPFGLGGAPHANSPECCRQL